MYPLRYPMLHQNTYLRSVRLVQPVCRRTSISNRYLNMWMGMCAVCEQQILYTNDICDTYIVNVHMVLMKKAHRLRSTHLMHASSQYDLDTVSAHDKCNHLATQFATHTLWESATLASQLLQRTSPLKKSSSDGLETVQLRLAHIGTLCMAMKIPVRICNVLTIEYSIPYSLSRAIIPLVPA